MGVVSIHVGQAGTETGLAYWDLLHHEHLSASFDCSLGREWDCENVHQVFHETENGLRSRAIFTDLDGYGPQNFRRRFYIDDRQVVLGKENAGNIFSAGTRLGKELMPDTENALRQQVEACDTFEGFHVHRALSGGSGSGYGNEILEHIQDAYSCDVAEFLLMPSLQYSSSNFVQDTYNTVLAIAYSVVHETIAPQYSEIEHVNRLYAQYVSAITTPLRLGFDRDLLRSTSDYATLIDSLHCKYQVTGLSPFLSAHQSDIDAPSPNTIASSASLNPSFSVSLLQPLTAACLLFRGDITPKEAEQAVSDLDLQFTNNRTLAVATNKQMITLPSHWDQVSPRQSACLIGNAKGMGDAFSALEKKYTKMICKRAFHFWYVGEGMEEGCLSESHEVLCNIISEYH